MENNYFRITGYYPEKDFCFIMDCYGKFEKLWQFSVYVRDKGINVLEVSKDGLFLDGNMDRAEYDKDKVIYWPQYAESFYKPVQSKSQEIPDNDSFKIVFTGNVGFAQGLNILPKVAKLTNKNVYFVIVGDGRYKDQLMKETEEVKEKFLFIDRQPSEKIPEILCSCDAAFISFMDEPLFEKTIPAKLQSYMACGMPILASAFGETKRIIEEAKCGICTPLGDEQSLSLAIEDLIKANRSVMSKNALKYCNENFNKDTLIDDIGIRMEL